MASRCGRDSSQQITCPASCEQPRSAHGRTHGRCGRHSDQENVSEVDEVQSVDGARSRAPLGTVRTASRRYGAIRSLPGAAARLPDTRRRFRGASTSSRVLESARGARGTEGGRREGERGSEVPRRGRASTRRGESGHGEMTSWHRSRPTWRRDRSMARGSSDPAPHYGAAANRARE